VAAASEQLDVLHERVQVAGQRAHDLPQPLVRAIVEARLHRRGDVVRDRRGDAVGHERSLPSVFQAACIVPADR
jgi:hypothetical protein